MSFSDEFVQLLGVESLRSKIVSKTGQSTSLISRFSAYLLICQNDKTDLEKDNFSPAVDATGCMNIEWLTQQNYLLTEHFPIAKLSSSDSTNALVFVQIQKYCNWSQSDSFGSCIFIKTVSVQGCASDNAQNGCYDF